LRRLEGAIERTSGFDPGCALYFVAKCEKGFLTELV